MLKWNNVVAGSRLCVLGDVRNPYTLRLVVQTPHGRYGFFVADLF